MSFLAYWARWGTCCLFLSPRQQRPLAMSTFLPGWEWPWTPLVTGVMPYINSLQNILHYKYPSHWANVCKVLFWRRSEDLYFLFLLMLQEKSCWLSSPFRCSQRTRIWPLIEFHLVIKPGWMDPAACQGQSTNSNASYYLMWTVRGEKPALALCFSFSGKRTLSTQPTLAMLLSQIQ